MKDIIILVADGCQEKLIEGLLPRIPNSSNTKPFTYDIYKHPEHDSGCCNDSQEILRPFINQYRYAIVILDYEGCGHESNKSCQEVEQIIEGKLRSNGWEGRNVAIVVNPEIENWVWINSQHVEAAIGWNSDQSLYDWSRTSGFLAQGDSKPIRPKETFEKALKKSNTSKSSAIFKKISTKVSYKKCEDEAFKKLLSKLIEWFREENQAEEK